MITLRKNPGDRIIELGGGDNPNPACDVNVDVRQGPKTNFVADFEEPLPINSDEWDGVFSHFVLEHVSWRKVKQFIGEMFRILKPGGRAIVATANTEAQLKWIQDHPEGWDGRNFFESASGNLFGDNDYKDNSHRCFFNPGIVTQLFSEAGFSPVIVRPYGERSTDMLIEAGKPMMETGPIKAAEDAPAEQDVSDTPVVIPNVLGSNIAPIVQPAELPPAEQLYDLKYFDGTGPFGGYAGGYRDYPCHEVTAGHVLARRPESVLELGCGRGYVLKRLEDASVNNAIGLDISKHAFMTRVSSYTFMTDLCISPWVAEASNSNHAFDNARLPCPDKLFDLCFSIAFLEHIQEDNLPLVIAEMKRVCKRGLHGITLEDDGSDRTRVTIRPRDWWAKLFAQHAPGWPVEIFDKEELERGPIPEHVLRGDGKIKLNVGSYTTMFHHGWTNLDVHDLGQFAAQNQYQYQRIDVRNGIPWGTGDVSAVFACHFLEHLTYREGLAFLRECRRVLRPDGVLRLIVPDAALLTVRAFGEYGADLSEFDAINGGCADAPTNAGKLWAMLLAGHQAIYDADTLEAMLKDSGFVPYVTKFRDTMALAAGRQVLAETLDMLPCLSLYMEGVPAT